MGKGVTLTHDEAEKLSALLKIICNSINEIGKCNGISL